MVVTHKIKMDLAQREPVPRVELVQDDRYSRNLEIGLFTNGLPFSIPADCRVLIRYRKKDGVGGTYDTMPDGSRAWESTENRLTVKLAPQVSTVAGDAVVAVSLLKGEGQLSCFEIPLRIQAMPCREMRSEPYIHLRHCLLQSVTAKRGDYLRVAEIDEHGQVTALEGAAVAAGNGIADWNASEDQPGHVRNRTHWVENVLVDPVFDGEVTGREKIMMDSSVGAYAVKVTSQSSGTDDLIGAAMVLSVLGAEQTVMLSAETVIDAGLVLGIPGALVLQDGDPVVLSLPEKTVIEGITFSPGTWFMCIPGVFYVKSVSCLVPCQEERVHPLDKKFLPEGIGGGIVTVTVTDNGNGNYQADKTMAELDEAYFSGMDLRCVYGTDGVILRLDGAYPGQGYSFGGDVGGTAVVLAKVVIMPDGVAALEKEAVSAEDIPKTLPNPKALVINGSIYDGSAAVNMNLPVLPAVTAENNGAILRVADGKWVAANLANAEGVGF